MLEWGKKIYRTSMLWPFKWLLFAIVMFFYHDLYLGTFLQPKFIQEARFAIVDVAKFHLRYPIEFLTLSFLLLPTFFYYSFLRGVSFYEKGFSYNRGLPFLNSWVPYADCVSYKLVSPNNMIAVTTKNGDLYLVADNSVERVIAILDQHEVKGDLARDAYVKLVKNVKIFFYMVCLFTVSMYFAVKLGLFRFID